MIQGQTAVVLVPKKSGLKPQMLDERCNNELSLADSNHSSSKIIVSKGWLVLFCLSAIPLVRVYCSFKTPFKIMTALKRFFERLVQTHKRRIKLRRIVTTMSTIEIFLVFMGCFFIVQEALFEQWCFWMASQKIMGNTLDDWIFIIISSLFSSFVCWLLSN